jgi:hypothetical protein
MLDDGCRRDRRNAAPKGQDGKLESLRQKDGDRTVSWRGSRTEGTEGDGLVVKAGIISQVEGTGSCFASRPLVLFLNK